MPWGGSGSEGGVRDIYSELRNEFTRAKAFCKEGLRYALDHLRDFLVKLNKLENVDAFVVELHQAVRILGEVFWLDPGGAVDVLNEYFISIGRTVDPADFTEELKEAFRLLKKIYRENPAGSVRAVGNFCLAVSRTNRASEFVQELHESYGILGEVGRADPREAMRSLVILLFATDQTGNINFIDDLSHLLFQLRGVEHRSKIMIYILKYFPKYLPLTHYNLYRSICTIYGSYFELLKEHYKMEPKEANYLLMHFLRGVKYLGDPSFVDQLHESFEIFREIHMNDPKMALRVLNEFLEAISKYSFLEFRREIRESFRIFKEIYSSDPVESLSFLTEFFRIMLKAELAGEFVHELHESYDILMEICGANKKLASRAFELYLRLIEGREGFDKEYERVKEMFEGMSKEVIRTGLFLPEAYEIEELDESDTIDYAVRKMLEDLEGAD